MAKNTKQPKFNFFVFKNGEKVNLKELSEEEQYKVGVMAYQTLVKNLGYTPVNTNT